MSMKTKSVKAVPKNVGGGEGSYRNGVPGKVVERNLAAMSPKTAQFEPTPAEPVRAHYKMAGGC